MKYLYVITSDNSDFYLEQTYLSMTSLRHFMPKAFISLLIDNTTENSLINTRKNILNIVDELKTVIIDNQYNKKARSRWLKTSMRQYIDEDFLFLDGDTIITEDLSIIENINIGAVLNEHTYLSDLGEYNPVYLLDMQKIDKRLGFSSTINLNTYFNSGVLFCKDCTITHNFFQEWHNQWLYCFEHGTITDQQSFNQANYSLGNIISELSGEWNCQILADGGVRFLHNAKIIHYFANMKEENPYILSNKKILENIKQTGNIDQNIIELLNNPKSLFTQNTRLKVINIKMRKFNKSITYTIAQWFFHSIIGTGIELLLLFIYRKVIKPFKKK